MSIDIAKSRRICDAATKGPWLLEPTGETVGGFSCDVVVAAVARGQCVYVVPEGGITPEANRMFIAHARTALPSALDEIERLRAELARLTPASSPQPAGDPPAPGHRPGSC